MIGFWVFMLIMNILIPFTMIGFGYYFIKRIPRNINGSFGYRTAMSGKSMDTWIFAHRYCGRIWFYGGIVMLPITLIVMGLIFGKPVDYVGLVGGILCGVQSIPMAGAIIPTEIALRRNFDKYGRRR